MAFTEKRLAGPQALTANTQTLLYTCPTAQTTTTLIKQFVVTNTGLSTTFNISLVPSGGTQGVTNRLFSATPIAANETIILDISQVMSSGDFISVLAVGSGVNMTVSGVENAGGMVLSGLSDNAVTTAKIADGNITAAKLGPDIFSDIFQSNVVANAAARPASPYEGQMVYQQDIDKILFWNGTIWRFMGDSTAQTESSMDDIGLRKIVSGSLAGGDTDFVGCFSSAYNVYEIYLTNVRAGGNAQLYFRMLSGTTVANTNNYDTQRLYVQGTSVGGARNLATIGRIGYMGGGTNQLTNYRMTLVNPNIAKYTFAISAGSYSDTSTLVNIEQNNVAHTLANAYDGIRIGSDGTATLEGTVTVYGVKQ